MAGDWDEVMRIHYARLGWGEYRPLEGFEAEPYSEAARGRQVAEGKL